MGIGTWHILVHQGQSDCFDGIQFASYVLLDIVKVSLQWISGKPGEIFWDTSEQSVWNILLRKQSKSYSQKWLEKE